MDSRRTAQDRGRLDNSKYWYRRAARMDYVDREPISELETIKATIDR
jgi:hypothetical protein